MQFQEIMRLYSLDVVLIAGLVCLITALLRKYCGAFYERAGQYLPFLLAVGLYLLYDLGFHHFDQLELAISKGLQCAVCAVLLKTAFEDWICREKKVSLPKDPALLAVMGILSTAADLAHAKALAEKFLSTLEQERKDKTSDMSGQCLAALKKVLPALPEQQRLALADALANTLHALEQGNDNGAAQ